MKTSQTTVSVVIPTADRPALLREALASVVALRGPDIELEPIVIDNGSGASTRAVAEEVGARYIRCEARGAAAARNVGIAASSGEFIAFLDDDDAWLPGHLRPHLQLMHERPTVAAVFGQVVSYDFDFNEHTPPWPDPFPPGRTGFERIFSYFPQIGATVVRASVCDGVGRFDERLLGDEDWDWQLRLALAHPIDFVAVPCVAYRIRPDGISAGDELGWLRMPHFDRAFWRNVRRAGSARPRWTKLMRGFLRGRGIFAGEFIRSAAAHENAGDRKAARRQLVRALRASPIHCARLLARQAPTRRAILRAVTRSAGAHT